MDGLGDLQDLLEGTALEFVDVRDLAGEKYLVFRFSDSAQHDEDEVHAAAEELGILLGSSDSESIAQLVQAADGLIIE